MQELTPLQLKCVLIDEVKPIMIIVLTLIIIPIY